MSKAQLNNRRFLVLASSCILKVSLNNGYDVTGMLKLYFCLALPELTMIKE